MKNESLSKTSLFHALLEASRNHDHFAFFITSREEFSLALGCKKKISLDSTAGAFDKLREFQHSCDGRIAGYLGYDLKNDIEKISSGNTDSFAMPEAVFFQPEAWVHIRKNSAEIQSDNFGLKAELEKLISAPKPFAAQTSQPLMLLSTTGRSEYMQAVRSLKSHLQRGDIYEVNYCMQFLGKATQLDPFALFDKLQHLTQAPFSVFSKIEDLFVLSASPERYLQNNSGRLKSQPIKGTVKRSGNKAEDEALRNQLYNDPKERSENVMIVDLVRNDLSRVAATNSVEVTELFGIHSFKTVHHMVSTIEANLAEGISPWEAIKATFPMGSMTGAPKISAMKLIDSHENFKRSAYSGAFGWMDVNGDFDFNVLIRTIFYNSKLKKAGFGVGSAITVKAQAEREYEECLLKAKALMKSLDSVITSHELTESVSE